MFWGITVSHLKLSKEPKEDYIEVQGGGSKVGIGL